MDIIVCLKQVPDTSEVRIDRETNTLIREGVPSIINPFDENALEEGIRLKEKFGGRVTALTMGPPQAEEALRKALAMGVDEAVLVSDRAFAGADTLATSYTLAAAIKKIGKFDLIFCGKQAIDGDTAQVGPGIAENLKLPVVAYVRKIEEIAGGKVRLERTFEDGYEVIEAPLPLVITVTKEINEPRLPSLRGVMAAKKAKVTVWKNDDLLLPKHRLGLEGSPTWVMKIFTPPPRGQSEKFEGDPVQAAAQVAEKLRLQRII